MIPKALLVTITGVTIVCSTTFILSARNREPQTSASGDAKPSRFGRCYEGDSSRSAKFALKPAKTYEGIWTAQFESSRFEPTEPPGEKTQGAEYIWLDLAPNVRFPDAIKDAPSARALVKFIGREPICTRSEAGIGFGHLGGADRLVIVERFLRIERIDD